MDELTKGAIVRRARQSNGKPDATGTVLFRTDMHFSYVEVEDGLIACVQWAARKDWLRVENLVVVAS